MLAFIRFSLYRRPEKRQSKSMRRVVITGIGAVSPNGIGRERFWEATRNGVSGVRRITRFDPSAYQVQVAGEVPDEFDENRYVEVKDRPHVSRAVPLAAASVAEAVADAGLDVKAMGRDELRGIGVIVGSGGGSQDFTEEQYRLYYAGLIKQCSVYTIPTGTIGTLASEVSMRFGFRGLSHIVSTGCTSSTDAIGYAFRNIQAGVLSTVVAGGVDSPIAPLILRGFQLMRIMSTRWNHDPTRASRPFSKDRDGFVIAEGSWFFVLEEMEQAKSRGAHIYGEIAGYGSTCEAFHRVRLEECGEEPARAIGMAVEEAGIQPSDIQYIHYHGTSTELNDRIETRAVKLAFNGHAGKLAGSSLKSMIGHPQGACGAAGIAATLLAMRDGILPPTINVDEPDENCDLDYITDIGRKMHVEHAVANCIAFGSKNSAMVLRRA
uniref:Beta-ketoacyl synthase n=1 Tax=Solibacter usitatus (strain Ellin6076) TaxID=234267 RepID=Q027A9_SOLUE